MALRKTTTKKGKTCIMVFGTFDMVHTGHRNFFAQARALAQQPYLVVSVARDKNVERIKGSLPENSQMKRLALVKSVPEVDKAVIAGFRDHMPHIVKERPQIIALGYDQTAYVRGLRGELKKAGLKTRVVRLKPYKEKLYKTSLIRKKTKR